MSATIEQTAQALAQAVAEGVRRDGWPSEGDWQINELSAALVDAFFRAHGAAWVGVINVYDTHIGPVIWPYDWAAGLRNFEAAFVIPAYDAELERLIVARKAAPYTGTADDYARVSEITDRIEALGGHMLHWV